uniref:Uncharacterized protein n=1 Tax=Chromera velia CCMP2878 TaxID=1169474 RepID=A0A0G4HGQ6_9ALVE|eukprot:Cvel_6758.t1-p1 / transcript=Cvel_6758.t1 / gene=Cvel_6758 / organism=Chromera_velia_CCMP2878 / gene_product=Probable dolichyl-diphosphooligosaccharide--protein, putative / transcript_product=Probable dolichyl-diphosphooligosaccharide--protein, putative / location=Cvel_scaffold339:11263-17979(+) / protein_length=361 / sequence_SO=supercontig / SO=protein_coding / is_pseudo=false
MSDSIRRMLCPLALAILCAVFQGGWAGAPGADKVTELALMTKKAPNHILHFSGDQYKKYVIEVPRPYMMLAMLSGDASYCKECPGVEAVMTRIARSYWVTGANKPSEGRLPVFFSIVDVGQERPVVDLHELRTIPHLVASDSKTFKKPNRKGAHPLKAKDNFVFGNKAPSPMAILDFVNGKTGRQVTMHYTFQERIRHFGFLLSILGGLCAVALVLVLLVRRFPILMPIGALLIEFVATTGIFHNISHGMVWQGWDHQTKQAVTFQRSTRSQYLGEGVMMAGTTVLSGVCLLISVSAPHFSFLRKRKLVDISSLIAFFFFVWLSRKVIEIYSWKTGWYSPTFLPAPSATMGPLKADRGNSF